MIRKKKERYSKRKIETIEKSLENLVHARMKFKGLNCSLSGLVKFIGIPLAIIVLLKRRLIVNYEAEHTVLSLLCK